MKLDALLGKFPALKLERPPELWEAETTDEKSLMELLEAMIAATAADTLNVNNLVVDLPEDEPRGPNDIPEGEFVAITASGSDGREPDGTWPGKSKLLAGLERKLIYAGAQYAYVRSIHGKGSITVLLDRSAAP